MNAEEFIDRFVDQYPTNHAELRILLDSFLEYQPTEQREASKQLSDEEAITAMFKRAEELELDLYKEEVEELYEVVKTRTGGGVDLDVDKIAEVIAREWDKQDVSAMSIAKEIVYYLTQRNQQEKG